MSNVLYRKYRSSNFEELLGQEHITKILKNAVKGDQLAHAYLFVGSRGTGKTSVARILAKAVNCTNLLEDGNPCGECKVCTSIASGNFMDLIEIDAASNRGIDQIRELKERIEFSPTEGKYKVYIIDEVHMLTTEAFNALLKTLEEPPAHVIFMLATTDVHKLPATILSRCQRYDFRLGNDNEIRELLLRTAKEENVTLEQKAMDILVRNAKGSYRDALSLLDVIVNGQLKSDDPHEITEDEVRDVLGIPESVMVDNLLCSLMEKDAKGALKSIQELESKGVNLQQFVNFTLSVLREVLVGKISGDVRGLDYRFVDIVNQRDLLILIRAFLDAQRDLKNTTNQILILEMLIPVFCTDEVVDNTAPKISKPAPKRVVKKVDEKPPEEDKEEVVVEKEESEEEGETIVEESSEPVEVVNRDSGDVGFDEIKKNWNGIAEAVKPINTNLFAFLGTAKPVGINGEVIQIEVPFQFHKEQIDSPGGRQAISQAIAGLLGVNCKVECTVNEKVKPRMQASADVVLKNMPVSEPKKDDKPASSGGNSNGGDKSQFFKKPKLSADVEALFDGM